jgi:hypothetical protein
LVPVGVSQSGVTRAAEAEDRVFADRHSTGDREDGVAVRCVERSAGRDGDAAVDAIGPGVECAETL